MKHFDTRTFLLIFIEFCRIYLETFRHNSFAASFFYLKSGFRFGFKSKSSAIYVTKLLYTQWIVVCCGHLESARIILPRLSGFLIKSNAWKYEHLRNSTKRWEEGRIQAGRDGGGGVRGRIKHLRVTCARKFITCQKAHKVNEIKMYTILRFLSRNSGEIFIHLQRRHSSMILILRCPRWDPFSHHLYVVRMRRYQCKCK